MSSNTPRRLRRSLISAAAVVGLAMATISSAFAGGQAAATHGGVVYDISVRASNGDAVGLAKRLSARGFDLIEKRDGAVIHVLGTASTARALATVAGAAVLARVPAAPQGPVAAVLASQDNILPKLLQGRTYPTYYGGYRTVKGYDEFESDLASAYPDLVKKIVFGKSFSGANNLNAVCVTEDAEDGCQLTPNVGKARFLLETHIHAREVATDEMAWRFLSMLVDGDGTDAQITSLLQSTEIWVVPEVNPDGSVIAEKGIQQDGLGANSPAWQRKNDDEDQTPTGGCPPPWAGSQPGVDLNRNWAFQWGGASTSPDPCSEVFLGTDKMSESETQAMAKLTKALFKAQKPRNPQQPAPLTTTGEMLTFHTDGGVNLIPWDYTTSVQAPNDQGLRTLAFRQSYYTSLPTGQAGQVLYDVGGGTDDWAYAALGIASGTWELADQSGCTGFFPPYSCMDSFAQRYLPGLVYTAAAARTPYQLSLGPTILSARTQNPSGGTVTVVAKADDAALGTSGFGRPTPKNVTDARIYVGTAPWDGGTPATMQIQGQGTSVTATADVTMASQQVLAWVQAKNANGDWGPALAVWIPAA
ncbi:MAG TPA: M14 family zinc carboxypeptidase [Actinomycetota bacterium]